MRYAFLKIFSALNVSRTLTPKYFVFFQQELSRHIVVKVVRIYEERLAHSKYGSSLVQGMEIRDENGEKQRLSIWRKHFDYNDITLNEVFYMKKLKVENYPPSGPPFNLISLYGVDIKKACNEVSARFGAVQLCDGTEVGQVEGVTNVAMYMACQHCTSKVSPNLKYCGRCKKSLKNARITHYFR